MGSLTVESQDEDEEMGSYLRTIYVCFLKLPEKISFFPSNVLFNSQVVSAFVLISLSIALGVLLAWHIYLSLQNKTTIEVCSFTLSLHILFFVCLFPSC